ncbi:MAG: hypothetical protein JW839_15900 [Candidatus Lokiarchaeota archaeon]|nr:hypothetical protein [Candidatus Lokiarchaeota archaeon]
MPIPQWLKALEKYEVVLRPDKDEAGWWAGAPSVMMTRDGTFYLAARMRDTLSPRGRRGYEIRLLESEDGITFTKIAGISRDDTSLPGFERPALLQDPRSGKFKLYGCSEMADGWGIWKLDDADHPAKFDPKTLKPVLAARRPELEAKGAQEHHGTFGTQYKDPFIVVIDGIFHMFVIGFDRLERAYHFTSDDGERWSPAQASPILENTGWHNCFTRPACLYPLRLGYMLVYEGSSIAWYDNGYNIATGFAYSLDLTTFTDLTPQKPALVSSTPGKYQTWRYSHWLRVGNTIHVFFEAACPDDTNELRVAAMKRDGLY